MKATLLNLGLKVCNDVLFVHGRLLHYVIRGSCSTGMPSGAMMDENYLKIMHDMGGDDTGSAVPQLRMHMLDTSTRDTSQHCDHVLAPADTPEPTAPIWDCTEPTINVDTHGTNADSLGHYTNVPAHGTRMAQPVGPSSAHAGSSCITDANTVSHHRQLHP